MNLLASHFKKIATKSLVLGNESADLDSVVSSMTLAFIRGATPLLNVKKEELFLRKDVEYLFHLLEIDLDTLFYQDELSLLDPETVILVDHNVLSRKQSFLAPLVVEIFDHHKDANGFYPKLIKKNIQVVGSTATLITKEMNEHVIEPELALFLLGAILQDTSDLQDQMKTTPVDIAMATLLKEKAGALYTPDFYPTLLSKKLLVDLNCPDLILKKDFKEFEAKCFFYGISSLPKGVNCSSNSWKNSFSTLLDEKQIEILITLTTHEEGRDAIFFTRNSNLFQKLKAHLLTLNDLLTLQEVKEKEGIIVCKLKEPLARKVFQPRLLLDLVDQSLDSEA